MSHLVFHRQYRLAGIRALLDLSLSLSLRLSIDRPPVLPTQTRLRLDIGLPETHPEPPITTYSGPRF